MSMHHDTEHGRQLGTVNAGAAYPRRRSVLMTLAALVALMPLGTQGTTVFWDRGGSTDSWNLATNWSPDGLPGSSDRVVLDSSIIAPPATMGMDNDFTIQTLAINSATPTALNANLSGSTTRTLTLNGDGVNPLLSLGTSAAATVNWGSANGTLNLALGASGTFDIASGKTLVMPAASTISGAGVKITKTGTGTVQKDLNSGSLTNSGSGGVGLSVQQGSFLLRGTGNGTYTLFGSSATALEIDGGTLKTQPSGVQFTLNNPLNVTSNGGALYTTNLSGNGSSAAIAGAVSLGGDLTWFSTTNGTPNGLGYQGALTGNVTLTGNRKLTINTTGNPTAPLFITGNIADDGGGARTLSVEFAVSSTQGLRLSGNNSGLTGGINITGLSTAGAGDIVYFDSTNALGGGGAGKISVGTGTAIAYNFAPAAADIAKIKSGSTGTLLLSSSSSQNIDLSAAGLNANMRLGAAPGTSVTYTGTLTPNGSTYYIGGGGGTLTLSNTNALTGNRDVRIGGIGPGGGDLMPAGVVILSGTNNYTGTTTVASTSGGGTPLKLGIDNALSITTNLVLESFTGVDLNGFNQEVAGLSPGGFGITNTSGTQATLTLNNSGDILNPGMQGTLTGNLGFTKKGAGILTFRSAMTYTGPTTVLAGKMQGFDSQTLPNKPLTIDGNTAIFELKYFWTGAGMSQTVTSLTVDHGGTLADSTAAGTGLLTAANYYLKDGFINAALGSAGAITKSTTGTVQFKKNVSVGAVTLQDGIISGDVAGRTLNGTSFDVQNGTVSLNLAGAAANLGKSTSGTVILSGANSYGGTTTVSQGTLLVNGSLSAGGGAVTVASGATLGGSGTINRAVTISNGAILAPGNSPGTLTIVGPLALSPASLLNFELGPSGTPGGVVNDLVEVTGNFTLDGILNVTQLAGFGPQPLGAPGIYRLFDYSGGSFTDNGLQVSSFGPNTSGWVTTINLSTAGQVNLIVIPEPATLGLLALGGLVAFRRRSRRA